MNAQFSPSQNFGRDNSLANQNVQVIDLYVTPANVVRVELDRKQFEGRNGAFIAYIADGALINTTLEIAFDNPDGKYFPLAPGAFIHLSPFFFSRLYIRAIATFNAGSSITPIFVGKLVIANHFVVDPKGSTPANATWTHPPNSITTVGNTGVFFANPGGLANIPPQTNFTTTLPTSYQSDPRNVALEIEIKNVGTGTVWIQIDQSGGVTPPTLITQLYPLGSGDRETFWIGADMNSSYYVDKGITPNKNNLQLYSDDAGAQVAYKIREYR